MEEKNTNLVIYTTPTKDITIPVQIEGDTVWLTQKQMAELFQKDVRTINEHIQNVYKEGELSQNPTIRKFRITAAVCYRGLLGNCMENAMCKQCASRIY
ncbi:MAG: hypothetical protein WCT40_04230 [Candidatus Magasanikbacteria bacterium]|jgi:hypothetical protein